MLQRNKANKNLVKKKSIYIGNIDFVGIFGNATQKDEQAGRLSCLAGNEAQCLLESTRDFKTKKGFKRVWLGKCQEQIRTDSIDICTKFSPKSRGEDFQHSGQFFK